MKANELYEVYDKLKVFCFQPHPPADACLHRYDRPLHNKTLVRQNEANSPLRVEELNCLRDRKKKKKKIEFDQILIRQQ